MFTTTYSRFSSSAKTLGLGLLLAASLAGTDAFAATATAAMPTLAHASTHVGSAHLVAVRTRRGCGNCGTVVGIRPVKVKAQSGSGVGAALGAVAGGVVGHQIGGGRGQDLATVGGAIAGGFAGNEVERRAVGVRVYDVTVRMDRGGTRTARVDNADQTLSNGSRVRVSGNNISRL